MSLSTRYLTNGKKAVYVAIDSSGPHPVRYVGEHREDIPESIRCHLPDGEPLFVGPDMAAFLHAQDILYPNFPKCGHPNYVGQRCIAESCRLAANEDWATCPNFPGHEMKEKSMEGCYNYQNEVHNPEYKNEVGNVPHILDSGDRTQFESGAVRDMRVGKGRCDLMPLDVVAELVNGDDEFEDSVFWFVYKFQETDDVGYLYRALDWFYDARGWDVWTMLLETAIHFEDGAKKYGDNNWRKGIPVKVFLDSALRHYIKFLRGDTDEPHDRAVCWNLMCAIWTAKHKPELDDYRVATPTDDGSVG